MTLWSPERVVEYMREILGSQEAKLYILGRDEEKRELIIVTSHPGILIGRDGQTVEEVENKSGWQRIQIDPWFLDEEPLEEELEGMEGFVRVIEKKEEGSPGKPNKVVIVEFLEGGPYINDREFKLRTGWDIRIKRVKSSSSKGGGVQKRNYEIERMPVQDARRFLMMAYPEVRGVVAKEDTLIVYLDTDELLTSRRNRLRSRKFRKSTGWLVELKNATDLSQTIQEEQILVLGPKCDVCRGFKEVLRPTFSLRGLVWDRVVCPVCKGTGRRL